MIGASEGPRPGNGNAAPINRPPNSIITPEAVQEAKRQIEIFVRVVFEPEDIVEVRTLPNGRSYWYTARELPNKAELLLRDNVIGQSVFVGVNPRKEKGGKGAADVALCRCLFADFDGIGVEEALRRWHDAGLGVPSLMGNSGHGVHSYLRLQHPIPPDKFTELQKRLFARVNSDKSIHDPPRIMRLPGFLNVKNRDKPVPCETVEYDEARRVELAELHRLLPAPVTNTTPKSRPRSTGHQPDRIYTTETIRKYLETNGVEIKGERRINGGTMLLLTRCPVNPEITSANCTDIGVLVADDGKVSYCNKHDRGQSFTWSDVRYAIEGKQSPMRAWPFPTDTLPEPICSYIEQASAAMGCDAPFVALPLLAALASAIGNTRTATIKRSWFEPCIVWAVVVAGSGTMKTPAMKKALQFLRKIEKQAFKEHETATLEYKRRQQEYEVLLREWKARGLKQGLEQPEPPRPPICRRYIVSDITVEAIAVRLRDQPRGLLLARDELVGWLRSFNQFKKGQGGDAQNWLELHHGGTLVVDRKTGDVTTIHVPHASVSITGGVQPEVLERALRGEHIENGLAARLLIYVAERKQKTWTDDDIPEETERLVATIFERLLALEPNQDEEGDPVPVAVPLTPEAKAAFIDFFGVHNAEQVELTGGIVAAYSKLEAYAARFALLIHFLRWAANDPTLLDADRVDEQSMSAGIRLCRWFCHEAKRFYGWLDKDDAARGQDRLLDLVRLMEGRVSVRDWQRKRRHRTADDAEGELNGFVSAGLGGWEDVPPTAIGGRPTRVFVVSEPRDCDKTPEEHRDS